MLKEIRKLYRKTYDYMVPGDYAPIVFAFADGRVFYNGKSLERNEKNFNIIFDKAAAAAARHTIWYSTKFYAGDWLNDPRISTDEDIICQNQEDYIDVTGLNFLQLIVKAFFEKAENVAFIWDRNESDTFKLTEDEVIEILKD